MHKHLKQSVFFLTALLLASMVQAAEIVLPAQLPGDDGTTMNLPAANEVGKDIFEGTVLPEPVPLAAYDDVEDLRVFEFKELADASAVTKRMPDKKKAEPEKLWLSAIEKTLVAKGAGETVVVDGVRYSHQVNKAKAQPEKWKMQDVVFDKRTHRFSGKLIAAGAEPVTFRGRYSPLQTVPVLKNRLNRGAVIADSDIEMRPVLLLRLRAGVSVTDPKQLVGRTLKRAIATGVPLRKQDLVFPTVVQPNSEVEMVYAGEALKVTDRGMAMEKGSIGDIIRVRNSKSGTTLRARVDGPNKVTVNYFAAASSKGEYYATN